MPQVQDEICGDLLENDSGSGMKSTTIPFFEFSVISEEGINLFVDMSSSMLDWSKRLENEVCLCRAFQENKFQSFRQELEDLQKNCKQIKSSFIWNTNSKTRVHSDDADTDLFPHSFNGSVVDCPDAENGTLEISENKESKIVHDIFEYVEQEEEKSTFSGCNSGVKDLVVSNTTSSPSHEEIQSSEADIHFATSSCMEVLAVDGLKTTLDGQNRKLCNKTCMNEDRQDRWSEVNADVPFSASSAINTSEMQSSEVAGLQKDVACSPFISDPLLNLFNVVESTKMGGETLAHSIEIDQDGHLQSSSLEEQACVCLVNETEASCKSGKKAEMSMSDGGHKRKKYYDQSDKGCGLYGGRILRSAKHHGRGVFLRRSKRLFSK